MELTANNISEMYSLIENKPNDEIEHIIRDSFEGINAKDILIPAIGSVLGPFLGGLAGATIPTFSELKTKMGQAKAVLEICKAYITKYSSEIKLTLQNNPQKTNYVLNIIQLLAPAIAQQYSGIPAMAIVGAITLLCRQGIDNFIKLD